MALINLEWEMLAVIAEYGAFTGAQAAGPAGVSAHIGSCQALCVCRRVRVCAAIGIVDIIAVERSHFYYVYCGSAASSFYPELPAVPH